MRYLIAIVAIAGAYMLFAEIGLSLAFATKQVTAVWPPTGIALAALLLGGYRMWPAIFIGAFVSNAVSDEPLPAAAAIAIGNTLGPLAGAFLLRRFARFDAALERLRDVIALVVAGAMIPMTVTATNGVLVLASFGIVPWSNVRSVWSLWWTGDTMGVLIVAPLILTWASRGRRLKREGTLVEGFVLAIALVAATWVSFITRPPLVYPLYPFLIWTAIRFRQRATTSAIAAMAAIAIWGTTRGHGPFAIASVDQRLVFLVTFLGVLSVSGLVLSALITERRVAEAELRRSQEALRKRGGELQNALERTTRVVETLSAAFLPDKLPQRADFRMDALYMTAGHEALIGGDWYDAFELPDGRIVISIGDVVGHGLDAAVSAGRIRQAIFATAFDAPDPAAVLERVNRMLQVQSATVATALVATIDRNLESMRYASAGHPPPIVASPSRAARSMPYGSIPLGVVNTLPLQVQTVKLERDAVVLFYTDGITEFKRDIELTEQRLLAVVEALVGDRDEPRPAIAVQRAVMGIEEPADDVALVVLQLSPPVTRERALDDSTLRKIWSFHSNDAHSAHTSRHELIGFIRSLSASEDELFAAELILGEVLANTVEHAPGLVNIEVDWTSTRPVVTIVDTGPGLARVTQALPCDDFAENGRGLFLISSLAADVRVEATPGRGTKMSIVLPVARENVA